MDEADYQDDEQVAENADEQNEALEESAHDSVVARVVRRIAEQVVVVGEHAAGAAPVRRLRQPIGAVHVPRVRLVSRPVPVDKQR